MDALSHHPKSNEDSFSNVERKESEILSYSIVNDDLTNIVSGVKLPTDIKHKKCKRASMMNQRKIRG